MPSKVRKNNVVYVLKNCYEKPVFEMRVKWLIFYIYRVTNALLIFGTRYKKAKRETVENKTLPVTNDKYSFSFFEEHSLPIYDVEINCFQLKKSLMS